MKLPRSSRLLRGVSDEMISEGVRVLRASGALAFQSEADFLLVRDLLETALARQALDGKSSSKKR